MFQLKIIPVLEFFTPTKGLSMQKFEFIHLHCGFQQFGLDKMVDP